MEFKLTIYPIEKLARAAGGTALDAVAMIYDGVSSAGQRAEEALSRMRLEKEVRDIEEEIDLQMRTVGEIMYAAHCGDTSAGSEIEEIMEYVDDLQEELEAHRKEKEVLKGNLICSVCGGANQSNSLYCQNCGNPLSRQ